MQAHLGKEEVQLGAAGRANRDNRRKATVSRKPGEKRQQIVLVGHLIDLVDRDEQWAAGGYKLAHKAVPLVVAASLEYEERHVDIGQDLPDATVHPLIQGAAVYGLKTGRIDENVLRVGPGENPQDVVPRRLCASRNDAQLFTAQGESTATYDQAAVIFDKMSLTPEYPEFLTLPLYEAMA
jgi:hypothetical protein